MNKIKTQRFSVICFCSAIVFFAFISLHHEPWFDEAQAWQIAKCASLKDILLVIPHYEGHPPLWHLILSIPAKLGIPFEIGLKSVGVLAYIATVWLLLRSPLPPIAKATLPFSYFFFYQYGIVVRPYCLMLPTVLLLAQSFKRRMNHPWQFVGLLGLLCLESAYGMLFACGIALCMAWDVLQEKGAAAFFSQIFKDPRTKSLCVLLVLGLLLAYEISPYPDTWVTSADATSPLWQRVICSLFTFLPECFLTSSSWFTADRYLLQHAQIPVPEFAALSLVGFICWILLASVGVRKNLKYLFVPYVLFSLFAAIVYMIGHHLGMAAIYALFWIWISYDDSNTFEVGRLILNTLSSSPRDKAIALKAAALFGALCLVIPCYWTISACITDWNCDYSFGRSIASYLKSNDLSNKHILSAWTYAGSTNTSGSVAVIRDTPNVSLPVEVSAYFDHNVSYNLNDGRDDKAFFSYRLQEQVTSQELFTKWRAVGIPDVLLGKPDLQAVFGDAITYNDYGLVHVTNCQSVWKDSSETSLIPVFVKKSLIKELGLKELDESDYVWSERSFYITSEMREQFDNGVPVEEILDPYLDKLFGEN